MWLFTRDGFYSVTAVPSWRVPAGTIDPHQLQVRARAREDLEVLKLHHNLTAPIVETTTTDYPYRLFLDRERLAEIVAAEVLAIDYDNFKNTIKDDRRHNIYLKVWGALLGLMPARLFHASVPPPKNGKATASVGWQREVYGAGKSNPGLFTEVELAAMNRDGVTAYGSPRQRRKRKGGR